LAGSMRIMKALRLRLRYRKVSPAFMASEDLPYATNGRAAHRRIASSNMNVRSSTYPSF